MSVVSVESVMAVASELGVDAEGVAPMVAAEVEYRLRLLIQDMIRFMTQSRRQRLTSDDTLRALRLHGYDGVFGFGSSEAFSYMRDSYEGEDVYFLQDQDVDLVELVRPGNLSKVPAKPSFSVHWLAIRGIQPSITENPQKKSGVKDESALKSQPTMKRARTLPSARSDLVEIKSVTKHVLSQELQLYYEKVISSIETSIINPAATQNVYSSIATDPGLHQLLPYFTKFIAETVNKNMRNCSLLTSVMHLARCLILNPHLQMELYLHQLMPAIVTCIVGKRLCRSPFEDHWQLRKLAASLIQYICLKYGELYPTLQPRITKTLHSALIDKKRPLTTKYGAIIGITKLGALNVENILLPVMAPYIRKLETALNTKLAPIKRIEAQYCFNAFQESIEVYLRYRSENFKDIISKETSDALTEVSDAFGESILPVITAIDQHTGLDKFAHTFI